MAPDASDAEIRPFPGGIELSLKVVPGASRTRVAGVLGTALKVAVAAPPEGGKANAAVIRLLADVLGVSKSDVEIVSGHGQPLKRVTVRGLTTAEARARLGVR